MLVLAIFPVLMIGSVVFAALSSLSEHETRWENKSTHACCPERATLKSERLLAA